MKPLSLLFLCAALLMPSTAALAQSSPSLNRAVNALNVDRDSQITWDEIQLLPSLLAGMDPDNSGSLINRELVMPNSSFGGRPGGGGFGRARSDI